jgi:CTD kinase subunit alpha
VDDPPELREAIENRRILEEEAYRRHPKKRPKGQTPRLKEGEVLDKVFRTEVIAVKHKIRQPQKVLPEEYRNSNVYYRKPGNESVVGFGTYGKVFKAKHIYKEQDVALKRLRMEAERDGFPITAMREMKILKHLEQRQGQGVIRLHELLYEVNMQNSVACFMVFEYMPHDLTGLLNHPTFKLTMAQKKDMARQTIDAIGFMHKNGVLHRDIKAANILVSHTGEVKLADFGLARFYDMDRQLHYTNRVVTIWYRAPELLYGQTEYGPAIDVWAVACVIVEIFTRHAIFPGNGKDLNQLLKVWEVMGFPTPESWPDVVKTEWYFMMRPKEIMPNIFRSKYSTGELGVQTTPALLDLLEAMLQYDPARRPTCDECLAHPFFTQEEPGPERVTTELQTLGDWHEFESKKAKRAKEAEDRVDKDLKEGPPSCGQLVRDERRDRGYRRDLLMLLKSGMQVEKRAANFSPSDPEAKRVRA